MVTSDVIAKNNMLCCHYFYHWWQLDWGGGGGGLLLTTPMLGVGVVRQMQSAWFIRVIDRVTLQQ